MTAVEPSLTVLKQPLNRSDIITEPLSTAIQPEQFTPRLLTMVSNALVYKQNEGFREESGRTTNEWRVLAAIAVTPGQSASEIADSLNINKSMLSTTVSKLAREGLLVLSDGPRGSHPMFLTPQGRREHDLLVPIALRGQRLVEGALGKTKRETLNELLQQLLAHLHDSEDTD